MKTELLVIEKLELVPFFTKGDRLDDTLEKVKVEATAHVPDVSTLKGRNAIKANVTKVTKVKTFLESHGKDLAAEYKLIPKAIDANRKKSKDFLNALVEEIREPLTAWETIDKAEKAQVIDTESFLIEYELQHEDGLRDNELVDFKAAQVEADRLAEIKAATEKAATEAKAKAEAEAAERIAQAERDKVAAEQRAIAAKQAVIDAENKAAQDAINAAAREVAAKQATKDAEWLTYIAEAYEINAKIDFDRQAVTAKKNASKQVKLAEYLEYIGEAYSYNDQLIATKNAQVAEAQRQQDLADQQKREQAAREADKNHKGNINRTAMEAFIHAGLSQEQAKLAVKSIAKGLIPAVTISY